MFWKVCYQGTRSKRHHLQRRLDVLTFNCSDMQCIVLANKLRGNTCSVSCVNVLFKRNMIFGLFTAPLLHTRYFLSAGYGNHGETTDFIHSSKVLNLICSKLVNFSSSKNLLANSSLSRKKVIKIPYKSFINLGEKSEHAFSRELKEGLETLLKSKAAIVLVRNGSDSDAKFLSLLSSFSELMKVYIFFCDC